MEEDRAIAGLREAVKISPDNVPLREHLADSLMALGRFSEAELEFSTALALSPESSRLKLGLALSSYQQSKYSQALVIAEDLIKSPLAPAGAFLLMARLFLNDGSALRAAEFYQKAIALDHSLVDAALAEQLSSGALPLAIENSATKRAEGDDSEPDCAADGFAGVEKPRVNFENVGGMEAVKEQIRMKIIYPITNAAIFAAYGKKIGGGILMYGPPGCGKTHLARATAGEINAAFISVGIADVLDMWIGSSERNLHELFEQARRMKPCVIFFDEVDALAASRSDMRTSSSRQIINQFLLEMDGLEDNNEGVLVLGATNAPWHLDSAFRRPGRFDRILFVPPPDAAARAEIFRILMKGKPIEANI
ncbi:MAG: AAA family ATPase, partial [Candidatus Obscuribacterales bacterium]|nr:AAA family ATPase [Candidatus Obscuribacterales bacterium]